jgi:hypothetical protein
MKPSDGAFVIRKLRRDLNTVAHLGSSSVQIEPMQRARWEGHLESLEVLAETLENRPAELLTEAQLINAALATPACVAAVLEQATEEALLGELARRGRWLLDTTPVPDDGAQRYPVQVLETTTCQAPILRQTMALLTVRAPFALADLGECEAVLELTPVPDHPSPPEAA